MKLRIDELRGTALNWAVAKVLGILTSADAPVVTATGYADPFAPATDATQALPLIVQFNISMLWRDATVAGTDEPYWWSCVGGDCIDEETIGSCGASPLEAALRAFVQFKYEEAPDDDEDDIHIDVPATVIGADAAAEELNAQRIARRIRKDMPAPNPTTHW